MIVDLNALDKISLLAYYGHCLKRLKGGNSDLSKVLEFSMQL